MRIAYTIILNGLHHIKHNDYYIKMLDNFDYWVVVDGANKSLGSTSWCKSIPDEYHNNGASNDGTVEFLSSIQENYENLIFVKSNGLWNSKDEQVNVAISEIKKITNECYLWQIDIDEQWDLDSLKLAEEILKSNNAKTGIFNCEYYVGDNLVSKGEWGESNYIRLWDWKGEYFHMHEPPIIIGGNGKTININDVKFKHYSYFFEKDVKFKNDYYSGHDDIYNKWLEIKKRDDFPIHISNLISGNWGRTNTYIHKL